MGAGGHSCRGAGDVLHGKQQAGRLHHDRKQQAARLLYGEAVAALAGSPAPALGLCFSPDGRTLVSGSADRTLMWWDLEGVGSR